MLSEATDIFTGTNPKVIINCGLNGRNNSNQSNEHRYEDYTELKKIIFSFFNRTLTQYILMRINNVNRAFCNFNLPARLKNYTNTQYLGIIAFAWVTGRLPDDNIESDIEALPVSPDLKDLLYRLLVAAGKVMVSEIDILNHPFFAQFWAKSYSIFDDVMASCENYADGEIMS